MGKKIVYWLAYNYGILTLWVNEVFAQFPTPFLIKKQTDRNLDI